MSILQLLPQPTATHPLKNLYLNHNLRQLGDDKPFVYSNFVVSLDGRIATPHPTRAGLHVPPAIANERDWRLFQELAAQADVIITTGRYLRDWADGRAQEILAVDDPRFADLRDWRQTQGLAPLPDLAVVSGSLNFPIPDVLRADDRKVTIFTTANPAPERVAHIEAKAGRVFVAGENRVDGAQIVSQLGVLGYRTIYSASGPKIMHTLLSAGVLSRLYLTYANRVLGGDPFATLVDGDLLQPAVDLRLQTLYFDSSGVDGVGQLFAMYACDVADFG